MNPPDPSAVVTAADFAAALSALRRDRGLSIRALSPLVGLPAATLGGYFSGRHLPAVSRQGQFEALLLTLGASADTVPTWQAALDRARAERRAARDIGPNPYRVDGYQLDDGDLFAGRTETVRRILAAWAAPQSPAAWICVVGGPGVGVSSLLRAGVGATLRARRQPVAVIEPGPEGLAVSRSLIERGAGEQLTLIVDLPAGALTTPEERAFVEAVVTVAAAPGVRVVAGLGPETLTELSQRPGTSHVLRGPVMVAGAPSPEETRDIVCRPSRRRGRAVEPALVDQIVRDVDEWAEPRPVLSVLGPALHRLWEAHPVPDHAAAPDPLRLSTYQELGGLRGYLRAYGEDATARDGVPVAPRRVTAWLRARTWINR